MEKSKNKSIWILNHYATDMYKNHGGRHYNFAKYLKKDGYDVKVFCANTFHNTLEKVDTNGKYSIKYCDDIPFIFVKTISSVGNGIKRVMNMAMFYLNIFGVVKKISKGEEPDVIIASSVHPLTMVAGIKIAKKLRIPCVCEVRDLWPEAIFSFGKTKETSVIGRILIKGEHWIYKKADKIIFTKPGDKDYLYEKKWTTEQGGDIDISKCYYINNGVDLESFDKLIDTKTLEDEDLTSDKFKVVYAGAIRPVNNVGSIVDCAKILKNNKDIEFLIYGEGNQLEELKKRVEDEHITNLKFKGYVNKQFIPYILSKSSLNILNYSHDLYNWSRGNSSNKLFEYMASGKPVISTVKMGYDIIEQYNCGISLDKNVPEEFAKAILKFKNLDEKEYNEYCKNARNGANEFDFENLTKKIIGVINDCI